MKPMMREEKEQIEKLMLKGQEHSFWFLREKCCAIIRIFSCETILV